MIRILAFVVLFGVIFFSVRGQNVPVIDSVSVTSDNKVVLTWSVENPDEVDGYFIFKYVEGSSSYIDGFHSIATVESTVSVEGTTYTGYSALTFTDDVPDFGGCHPDQRPETYGVAAYSLDNGTYTYDVPSLNMAHSTIFLSKPVLDKCKASLSFTWTPYVGWRSDLKEYQIMCKKGSTSQYKVLATVNPNLGSYSHINLTPKETYTYYIRAFNKNGATSTSNVQEIFADFDKLPEVVAIRSVSTESESEIKVTMQVDPTATVREYQLLKAEAPDDEYDTLAVFPNGGPEYEYVDSVQSTTVNHYYKFRAITTCDEVYKTTAYHTNIVLMAGETETTNNDLISLAWSEYVNWPDGVEGYNIYRSVNGSEPEFIKIIESGENTAYTDDVSEVKNSNPENTNGVWTFCYYVEAVESNSASTPASSKSNRVCITQITQILLPNAFNPLSMYEINRTFKPILPDVTNYSMVICTRWGTKIFETTDPSIGWDGRVNEGELASEGTYVYYLSFSTSAGTQTKLGYVTVFFP